MPSDFMPNIQNSCVDVTGITLSSWNSIFRLRFWIRLLVKNKRNAKIPRLLKDLTVKSGNGTSLWLCARVMRCFFQLQLFVYPWSYTTRSEVCLATSLSIPTKSAKCMDRQTDRCITADNENPVGQHCSYYTLHMSSHLWRAGIEDDVSDSA